MWKLLISYTLCKYLVLFLLLLLSASMPLFLWACGLMMLDVVLWRKQLLSPCCTIWHLPHDAKGSDVNSLTQMLTKRTWGRSDYRSEGNFHYFTMQNYFFSFLPLSPHLFLYQIFMSWEVIKRKLGHGCFQITYTLAEGTKIIKLSPN